MGTVLLVVLVAGAVVFLMNRSRGTDSPKAVKPVKPTEPVQAAKRETASSGGNPVTVQRLRHEGASRTDGPRLTAEQCRELARIHRQNMLDRQHDSRMSAAAAVAGAVAGGRRDRAR